jgi:hypothetical protein
LPLAAADELKVGVLWCVSDWDSARSIPLDALEPLRRVRGARFYSLQQGAAADTWDKAPVALEPLSEHTREITAAAAAMLDLDLVIVPDCMAAHLAGALGRRAWVVLLHEADWRWMEAGSTSPWYPTLRLYRQPTRDDWVAAMEVIATDLQKVVDDARAVRQ